MQQIRRAARHPGRATGLQRRTTRYEQRGYVNANRHYARREVPPPRIVASAPASHAELGAPSSQNSQPLA